MDTIFKKSMRKTQSFHAVAEEQRAIRGMQVYSDTVPCDKMCTALNSTSVLATPLRPCAHFIAMI